jgi:hypothetical protein
LHKINAAPLALLLPLAMFLRFVDREREEGIGRSSGVGILVVAGAVSLLVFRISNRMLSAVRASLAQPNPAWVTNLNGCATRLAGCGLPPALQWKRRPVWFAWQNMVLWGRARGRAFGLGRFLVGGLAHAGRGMAETSPAMELDSPVLYLAIINL